MLKAIADVYSGSGGRPNNEDSYLCEEFVWAVADGLGGHNGSEYASALAVNELTVQCCKNFNPTEAWMKSTVLRINQKILDAQDSDPSVRDMRTTFTAAFLKSENLSYISIGDTRLYLFRDGKIDCLTHDDSAAALMLKNKHIKGDVRESPARNMLNRTLGDPKNSTPRDENCASLQVKPGDALLLCTDGFWDYVYETEMLIDYAKSTSPSEWLHYMLKRLFRRAPNGHDNLTAVCVMLQM